MKQTVLIWHRYDRTANRDKVDPGVILNYDTGSVTSEQLGDALHKLVEIGWHIDATCPVFLRDGSLLVAATIVMSKL